MEFAQMLAVNELLHGLASELGRIRKLPVGSYPHDFPRPPLKPLLGTTKTIMLQQMGEPDFRMTTDSCERIAYFFYVASPGMRGGGGVAMEIDFDNNSDIVHAKWQLQR